MISRRGRLLPACAVMLTMLGTQRLAAQAPPVLPSTRVLQAGPGVARTRPSLCAMSAPTPTSTTTARRRKRISPTRSRLDSMRSFRSAAHGSSGLARATSCTTGPTRTSSRSTRSSTADTRSSTREFDRSHRPASPPIASARAWRSMRGPSDADHAHARERCRADAAHVVDRVGPPREHGVGSKTSSTTGCRSLNSSIRRPTSSAAGARFRLTPFTSLTAVAEIQRDRFETSPERDADSLRLAPSVEFDNGAALTGRAQAGYRVFRPLSACARGLRRVRRVRRSAIRVLPMSRGCTSTEATT